jgi:hypothetical protein
LLLTGIDGRRYKATTAALVRGIPAVSADEGKVDGEEDAEADLQADLGDAEVGSASASGALEKTPELHGTPVCRVLRGGGAPARCLRERTC